MSILLPTDDDQRWLPDPIPASYYVRVSGAAPWSRWTARLGNLPARRVLAGAAVGAIGIGLVVVLARAVTRPPAGGQGQAAALASPANGAAGQAASPPADVPPFAVAPTATPTPSPTPQATPTPVTLSNGPLSARRGQSVTLVAQTAPRTACSAAVQYPLPPTLTPATSNRTGLVSWTWTVGRQVPTGTWPIEVSCGASRAATTITVR